MNKEFSIRLLSCWCLCILLMASVYGASHEYQQISLSSSSYPPILSDRALKQLKGKLEAAASITLQVDNADGAPLEIKDAKVAFVTIEGNYDPTGEPVHTINDYAVKMRLHLLNRTGRRVTGLGLEFKDPSDRNGFFVYRSRLNIAAGKIFTLDIPLMVLTGNPSGLLVELYGAAYDDTTTWRSFPVPQPRARTARSSTETGVRANASPAPPDAPIASPTAPSPAARVDTRPRPLNSPQPWYTEQARKNGVFGMVRVRVLVGADGTVMQVKTLSTLPDFLTEQAIRAANGLKFEPARKDGTPVAYWMLVIVEFNLK